MNTLVRIPHLETPVSLDRAVSNPSAMILYVANLMTGRKLNSLVLSQAGYHVDEAEDGLVGWQMAESKHYDLIIADCRMGRLTGLEFFEWLRGGGIMAPVIFISDAPTGDRFRRERWLGSGTVLPPTFTAGQLLEAVRDALHSSRPMRRRLRLPGCCLDSAYHHRDHHLRWGINE